MTKALLKSVLPSALYGKAVRVYRGWRASQGYQQAGRIAEKLFRRYGTEVQGGPFKGMRLRLDATGSALAPKLVGSYEAELHRVIEAIVARGYSRVVDVGSAEGFYAVGLALRLPGAEVWAFDIDPAARDASAALALLNGVSGQVRLGAECDHASLDELSTEDTVIVCDIEGAELALLDPRRAPGLARADILVEIHPSATEADPVAYLRKSFAATHAFEVIASEPRNVGDYAWLREELSQAETEMALCEFRPPMYWGFLKRLR